MRRRIKSFQHAIAGLVQFFAGEINAKIHFAAAVIVISAGFFFTLSTIEWIATIGCIGFVISMEILNTAVEHLADFVSPQHHAKIKLVKDIAAAAVFVSAITVAVIGNLVFFPNILSLSHQ